MQLQRELALAYLAEHQKTAFMAVFEKIRAANHGGQRMTNDDHACVIDSLVQIFIRTHGLAELDASVQKELSAYADLGKQDPEFARRLAAAHFNLAEHFRKVAQYDRALKSAEQALALTENIQDKGKQQIRRMCLVDLVTITSLQKDFVAAARYRKLLDRE